MKNKLKPRIFLCLIFLLLVAGPLTAQDIHLLWNTFLGSGSLEYGLAIALDGSGRVLVTGGSESSWGAPVNGHSGGDDAFVACLDSDGHLIWNTFLGSGSQDYGRAIALDGSGRVLVTGNSRNTWGAPVNGYRGGGDAFVACLDSDGHLVWNTFLGSGVTDNGSSIATDSSGRVLVTGMSNATWGAPVNGHSGLEDVFVACLDSDGHLIWNTFQGSGSLVWGYGIACDGSDRILVTGRSTNSWGAPVNGHSGAWDAFVACLDSDGYLIWNTFLGCGLSDEGYGIVSDSPGRILVAGQSYDTWGAPVRIHSGAWDAFVACLDSDGYLVWNTFLGSGATDYGRAIALDGSGRVLVAGSSSATWGDPVSGYSGSLDAFAAGLDSDGHLIWNTFMGSGFLDYGHGITSDSAGRVLVAGYSSGTWGTPLSYFNGGSDVFVAALAQTFQVRASVSGSNGRVSPAIQNVNPGDSAAIHIYPDPGYQIGSITDNGTLMAVANPYVINDVRENHEVTVSFTNIDFPPTMNLSALRKTDSSWITLKEYGEVSIEIIEHPDKPMPVSCYILYRLDGGSEEQYTEPGSYTYIDKFLEPGKTYSYRILAVNSEGFVMAVSRVVTI
jgi:uncharacterized protein YvpB